MTLPSPYIVPFVVGSVAGLIGCFAVEAVVGGPCSPSTLIPFLTERVPWTGGLDGGTCEAPPYAIVKQLLYWVPIAVVLISAAFLASRISEISSNKLGPAVAATCVAVMLVERIARYFAAADEVQITRLQIGITLMQVVLAISVAIALGFVGARIAKRGARRL